MFSTQSAVHIIWANETGVGCGDWLIGVSSSIFKVIITVGCRYKV